MSAENSISSLLSKTSHNGQQMSTLNKGNLMTSRPNLFHTFKIQGQVKKDIRAKNMKQYEQPVAHLDISPPTRHAIAISVKLLFIH